ncbi:hypothetical protein BDW62DRAFT_178730 [Aspergillus aurantiobrunneus]
MRCAAPLSPPVQRPFLVLPNKRVKTRMPFCFAAAQTRHLTLSSTRQSWICTMSSRSPPPSGQCPFQVLVLSVTAAQSNT